MLIFQDSILWARAHCVPLGVQRCAGGSGWTSLARVPARHRALGTLVWSAVMLLCQLISPVAGVRGPWPPGEGPSVGHSAIAIEACEDGRCLVNTELSLRTPRAGGVVGVGSDCSWVRVSFWGDRNVPQVEVVAAQHCGCASCHEPNTFKWFILFHVGYTSIFFKKRIKTKTKPN